MPALALPAFWGAVTAASAGGATVYGAHKQASAAKDAATMETAAANHAADLQDAASKRSEAFLRQQGENAYQNSEAARQGNYGMYAAGQRRLGFLGEEVGLGPREIPGYVPGVDPRFTGEGGTVGAMAGGAPPDLSGVQAKFNELFPGETLTPEMLASKRAELEALGFTLNPNAAGKITDLSYRGVNIDPIQGAGSGLNRKQWLVSGPGGADPAPTMTRPVYTAPSVPFLNDVRPSPALSYLGSY